MKNNIIVTDLSLSVIGNRIVKRDCANKNNEIVASMGSNACKVMRYFAAFKKIFDYRTLRWIFSRTEQWSTSLSVLAIQTTVIEAQKRFQEWPCLHSAS